MTTYTIVTDDTFTRANTSYGSGANSTNVTGPGTYNSPSTGGNYIDSLGNAYEISSNTLIGNPAAINSGNFASATILRPTTENVLEGQVVTTAAYTSGGSALGPVCRYQSGKGYATVFFSGGAGNTTLAIGTITASGNNLTLIGGSFSNMGAVADGQYVITLTFSGSNPTTLTTTIASAATPGTIIKTVSCTDSTSGLQTAGQQGLTSNIASGGAAPSVSRLTTYQASAGTGLAIGTLTATASATSVALSLSAGLSGGSGTGYQYKIYRGTDPNFTANAGSLLATVSSMPYTDVTPAPGTEYFYGVVGNDSASATVNAIPTGLTGYVPAYLPYVPAQLQTRDLNMVFIGDSITYGGGVTNAGTVLSPTMPYFLMTKLKRLLGIRTINGSNQGHSGYTFTDWAPTGSAYAAAKSAMQTLVTADPAALSVFSILLGTNDSAQSGTNNSGSSSPVTPTQIQTLAKNLINQLLSDFPTCKVFVHLAPWYSPSTHNSSNYEQVGLSALYSYRSALTTAVSSYGASNPGQVLLGDTYAFQYFAQNGVSGGEQQAESGSNGIFYLHPAGTAGANGLIGTQSLGEMQAEAIANALYGAISRTIVRTRIVTHGRALH